MNIKPVKLNRFAQVLIENKVRIVSELRPDGKYTASYVHKKLGSGFQSSIRLHDNSSVFISGIGKTPKEAASALIEKTPSKGKLEFHSLADWENLVPERKIDYKV